MQVFPKPMCPVCLYHTHITILTKQNLDRGASVARFSSCLAVCLGFWEAQLAQLSTLALALKSDGHVLPGCSWTPCSSAQCSLGPRTLQMIYYRDWEKERDREFSPNPSSHPSQSFASSSLLNPSLLCFLSPFFVRCSWRTQGLHSLSHVFFLCPPNKPCFFYLSLCCRVRIGVCSCICIHILLWQRKPDPVWLSSATFLLKAEKNALCYFWCLLTVPPGWCMQLRVGESAIRHKVQLCPC